MSAKCPLNCSAVELWYKMMLEIHNQSDLTENSIKRKATGSQRLSSNWLWLFMAAYKPSFPDAEFAENRRQYIGGGYVSHDFGEVVYTLAEIFGDEVGGDVCVGRAYHAGDGFVGTFECLFVALVGYENCTVVCRWNSLH